MAETKSKSLRRRDFLKVAGVTGAAAGAAAVVLSGKTASARMAGDVKSGGYQETEHVKTYYELARF